MVIGRFTVEDQSQPGPHGSGGGGHRRGYQPGRIRFNDVECFGSESGAQQSNDTLVELLEDGDQIPKED